VPHHASPPPCGSHQHTKPRDERRRRGAEKDAAAAVEALPLPELEKEGAPPLSSRELHGHHYMAPPPPSNSPR